MVGVLAGILSVAGAAMVYYTRKSRTLILDAEQRRKVMMTTQRTSIQSTDLVVGPSTAAGA